MTTHAMYLRMSQDRKGLALGEERHEAAIRERAAREGITDFVIYADNNRGASALSRKVRPGFQSLLRDVAAGRITHIWAYSVSRITRRMDEGTQLVALAEGGSLTIRTIASGDPDLNRADGRATFYTILAWDAAEAERIGERVSLQVVQRAQMGRNHGGSRSFGYSPDGSQLVPAEAEAIAWAYAHIISGGSLRSVCAEWKARGLVGPKGAALTPQSVKSALLRSQNAGLTTFHAEIVGPSLSPAIVSEDDWRQAREILTDPARKAERNGRPASGMLAGLLKCGKDDCGSPCYTRKGQGPRKGTSYYVCHSAHHITRKRDDIDALLDALVVEFLTANREALRAPVAGTPSAATDEIDRLRDRLERLARLFHAEALDPEDYAAAAAPVRAALRAAEARAVVEARRPATAALVAAEDIPAAWAAADLDTRRTVLREVLERVTMYPGVKGSPKFDPSLIVCDWAPVRP